MQNEVADYSPNHFKKVIPKKSYKKPSAHFIKQDNLVFGIVIVKNREITFMNDYAKKMIGFLEDESFRRNFIDLFHQDYQENIQRKIDSIIHDHFPDNRFIAKITDQNGNGKVVDVELSSFMQNNELYILVFLFLIKEKKRALDLI